MLDKTYNSFLQAFEKFKNTKGVRPILVRSDNERTFLTAEDQESLRNQCFETEWHFNPPQTPRFGGFYERLIRMVKDKYSRCFNRMLFDTLQDFEVAVTYLEYILNNRPLYTKGDPITGQLLIIRPSHFIHPGHPDQFDQDMTNLFSHPTEEAATKKQLERQLIQLNKFKKRLKLVFNDTYVDLLRKVHLNSLYSRNEDPRLMLEVGDAVLVKPIATFKQNSSFAKSHWPIGKVEHIYEDQRTGRIRYLDVSYSDDSGTQKCLEKFPLQHFAPLEIKVEEALKLTTRNPSRTTHDKIR
jgi:hypothetical protein